MRLCIETKKQCILHKIKEPQFKLQMNWKVSAFYDVAVESPTSSSSLIITLPRCVLFTSWSISVSDFRPYAILHSTMYLLNRILRGIRYGASRPLHSTMYLLNREGNIGETKYYSFTFHNVSIKSNILWRDAKLFTTLHSTMYLLNQKKTYALGSYEETLHSTMYLLNREVPLILFYLRDRFTFHNVSIKSYCTARRRTVSVFFTFHNVSIKSSGDVWKQTDRIPLHSTMYLLNPWNLRIAC